MVCIECWTFPQKLVKSIEAIEMWFLRKIMKIFWTSHTTNEDVLMRGKCERKLVTNIQKRQMHFVCRDAERRNKMFDVNGKIPGKGDRGE